MASPRECRARRRGGCSLAALILLLLTATTANAQQTESVEYYATDAIGSVRIVFDANGTVIARLDFDPFGRDLGSTANAPDRRFAGLFRDGEAGLDYAEARSYQERTGRFNAPDSIFDGLFNPQRWNRYAYAQNNPVALVDPSGLNVESPDSRLCTAEIQGMNKFDWHCPQSSGLPSSMILWLDLFWLGGPGSGGSPASGYGDEGSSGGWGWGAPSNTAKGQQTPDPTPTTPPPPTVSVPECKVMSTKDGTCLFPRNTEPDIAQIYQDAWRKGYFQCIGDELFPYKGLTAAAGAELAKESMAQAAEANAERMAGAYYHFKYPKWFKAWGTSSKVMVPRAAKTVMGVAKAVKAGGLLVTDVELFLATYSCSDKAR